MKRPARILQVPLKGSSGRILCPLVLLFSSFILSYSSILFVAKAWVFLGGVLLPLYWMVRSRDPQAAQPERDVLGPVPPWIWVLLVLMGTAVRTFKLGDFRSWPVGDEALQAFFALELAKDWNWQFFYTSGQHPPLLIWTLALLFKRLDPFPDALWILPALFSCLTFGFSYLAARQFVGKQEAFLFFLLMAFSFWPMIFGRWCVQGALVPFFEIVCFLLLGLLLNSPGGRSWKAAALGICLGLGSMTFTSWLAVIAGFVVLVSFWSAQQGKKGSAPSILFGAGLLAAFSPWLLAALREGFGGYAKGMSMASGYFDWNQQVVVGLSYLTALFWGPLQGEAGYGAVWGGMMNPLLVVCSVLGIVDLFYRRGQGPVRWGFFLAFLFLLPGLLTADHVEMFRVIQVMPFLLFAAALGMKVLLRNISKGSRVPVLAALMAVSFALDLFHLVKPQWVPGTLAWEWSRPSGDPNHGAYLAFQEAKEKFGPGMVFTEFLPLARNHSLRVGVHSFNALDHPDLDPARSRWAGILVNVHYRPYLERRFPGAQWRSWDQGSPEDGGLVAGILPVDPSTRPVLDHWVQAHRHFHRLGVKAENMFNDRVLYRKTVLSLPEGHALMEGDPFLESLYGEWCAQFHYGNGLKGNILALERALEKGYPTANLYFKLGSFHHADGNQTAARKAFQAAAGRSFDMTAARRVLDP